MGQPATSVKHLWVCLHGYGQIGEIFARRFEKWNQPEHLFLIPEGPHRFYLQGTEGHVGASWMTKVDRLNDIEDQFSYLEGLTTKIGSQLHAGVSIHVLGFSQGVATALRWIDQTKLKIHSLICWAGTFPPDIDYKLRQQQFAGINFHACFGDEDEFISMKKAKEMLQQLQDQQIEVQPHYYKGGHKMFDALLDELIRSCEDQ